MAVYSFDSKDQRRFQETVRFALKGSILLSVLVTVAYTVLARPLIGLFNQNPAIISYGADLLISQVALYIAFGLCYMMTITYQTIGESGYGLFLTMIRQGLLYVPAIFILPKLLGARGIYFAQTLADVFTIVICVLSISQMKHIANQRMSA